MLPFEPLWQAICDRMGMLEPSVNGAARYVKVNHAQLWRVARRGTVDALLADKIAVEIGLHPYEIYGDAWIDAGDGRG
jgi:hypothetical protein